MAGIEIAKVTDKMEIRMSRDVAKVVNFMMRSGIQGRNLRKVAHAVAKLADFLWEPSYIESNDKAFVLEWSTDLSKCVLSPPQASTSHHEVSPSALD